VGLYGFGYYGIVRKQFRVDSIMAPYVFLLTLINKYLLILINLY